MSSRGKKRKRPASPDSLFTEQPPIQKLRIKPMPEMPEEPPPTGRKHSKKRKQQVSPISTTSISPTRDGAEDGGLKMKIILSPKKQKAKSELSVESDTQEAVSPKGESRGKKKKELKARLFFEDQVLMLDGEKVTHHQMQTPGKKRKSSATLSDLKQSPEQPKSAKKKKKDAVKVKEESMIPPFTKVPKNADRAKIKSIKTESDSGYSDTPTTSGKGKKVKAKLQAVEEHPVPSPQTSDVSKDSFPKKKKRDKEKKKKKMFKFKGDRNRFLNIRDSSEDEGEESFSRSLIDDDSLGGTPDLEEEQEISVKKEKPKKSKVERMMMPQMPVPDYNLEKQATENLVSSTKSKAKRDDRKESGIQSSRAEDLISQLTAYGSEMETVYPSYMLAPNGGGEKSWIKRKKKKKKLSKDKKKKKLKVLERDELGNAKYVIRKTKLSGYMLWCRSYRSTFVAQNPGLDFSTISRRMGALWQTLPEDEKKEWRSREITVNTRVPVARLSKGKDASALVQAMSSPPFHLKSPKKSKVKTKKMTTFTKGKSVKKKPLPLRLASPKWQPIDCAAYMRLLGESLSDVGGKLQTHRDNIEVHGSVSVLLDSMLCALGPLMCLTEQTPELNSIPKKTKTAVLDNIAYIMPGL